MWNLVVVPQKRLFTVFITVTIIHAAVTVSYAKYIEFLTRYITGALRASFSTMIIFSLIFAVITAFINVLGGYCKGRVTNGAMSYLKNSIFKKYLYNLRLFKETSTGSKIAFLTSKLDIVEQNYVGSFLYGISLFFQFLFALMLAMLISTRLTLMILIFEIPAVLLPIFSKGILRKFKEPVLESLNDYSSSITNWLSGISVIRNFGKEKTFFSMHVRKSLSLNAAQNRDVLVRKVINGFSQLFGDLVYLSSWLVGGYLVLHSRLEFPSFIAFTQLSSAISFPLETFSGIFSDYFGGQRAFEEFNSILTKTNQINSSNRHNVDTNVDKTLIDYSNVTIMDSSNRKVLLSHVDFKLSSHEKIVLIGDSGSGKSTLVNTLLGYHSISEGSIYINGRRLQDVDEFYVPKIIGFQEQQPFIFDGTVRDNLTMFSDGISQNILFKSLHEVGLGEKSTNDFLNHHVKTSGEFLSGGERQRICLARNLLAKKEFMIFDELTSGLDHITAKKIEEMLFNLNIGFIYITHNYDMSLLKKADLVIKIEHKTAIPISLSSYME